MNDKVSDFISLPPEEQHKVLSMVDSDYEQLPPDEQAKVIQTITASDLPKFLGLTGVEKPTKGTFKKIGAAAVEAAPEVIGGAAGGLLTGGSIPGIMAGAMVGRAMKETGEHIGGQLGPLPETPKPFLERAKDVGWAGATAGAGELGGRVVFKALGRLLSPAGEEVVPGALVAAKRTEPFMSQEGVGRISKFFGFKRQALTPGQLSESGILDITENATRSSIFGRKRMNLNDIYSKKALTAMTDDFIEKFGTKSSPEEIGHLFLDTLQKKDMAYFSVARELYKKVDDLTKAPVIKVGMQDIAIPEIVSTRAIKDFSKEIVKQRGQGLKSMKSMTGDAIIDDILQLPDRISFAEAQLIRSQLIKASAPITESGREVVKGIAKGLSSKLDGSMAAAAKDLSPEALNAWRTANAFWKSGKETYRNAVIKSMLKREDTAENVIDTIFKSGASSTIRAAREVVDQGAWNRMQQIYLMKVIQNSIDDQGNLIAHRISGQFQKMGIPALQEIFGKGKATGLQAARDLDEVARLMQDKATKLSGGMMIQLVQAGAVMQLGEAVTTGMTKNVSPVSIAALIAPPFLARILTNPITARWLIQGMKLPKGSKEMFGLAGRISLQINKEIKDEESQ